MILPIERKLISYKSIETGLVCQHHVLIASQCNKHVLLSYPNLFLYEHARSSIDTSSRYSGVISMFYRFLSGEPGFKEVGVSNYHAIADNLSIKRWQVARQEERLKKQKRRPSSQTIFEDAKLLLVFFSWLEFSGFTCCVNVKTKTWRANFRSEDMLNYVRKSSKDVIDPRNIEVLDREHRQSRMITLITNDEIRALINSYRDPVYAAMFKLALGTAMRPMDLVRFPLLGNGPNKHILPYSEMSFSKSAIVSYVVTGSKGNKTREIKINRADLRALEDHYIKPHYYDRAAKYEARHGEKCPPSVLFLNRFGEPVTRSKVSSRTRDAKIRAKEILPEFREAVNFYETRHWWPTMFLMQFFKDKLLTEAADALYVAAAQVLRQQMGHENLATTYKHYVDMARLVALSQQGQVHELVTEPNTSVEEFIDGLSA